MKRIIFTIVILVTISLSSAAQHSSNGTGAEKRDGKPQVRILESRATGDTLFHFEGYYIYINEIDSSEFRMHFRDLDSLTPHPNNYFENSIWNFVYRVLEPGDTLNWVEATSWFEPAGQADDWITFGPLSVPSGGAELTWRDFHNPQYRNGYQVKISSEGMEPENFTNDPSYVLEDLYQESSADIDTNSLFQNPQESLQIPEQYNDSSIYIAIHHNSEDMDVLHLRDIVLRRESVGIEEQERSALSVGKAYPNPASGLVKVEYITRTAHHLHFRLYNLAGNVLLRERIAIARPGKHTFRFDVSEIQPGMYFYEMNNGTSKVTLKLVVK